MANYRQIHTQIWKDEWFIELTTDEKLLFIYLFSNDNSSLTGIYKISPRVIAFETGIDPVKITSTFEKFEQDQRVVYRDGVIWIVHMWRYHSNASPLVKKRVENDVALIHDSPIKRAYIQYQSTGIYSMDTISEQYQYPVALTNLNLSNPILSNHNQSPAAANLQPQSNIFKLYEQNIGQLTPLISEKLKAIESDYPADWIEPAFQVAINANARNLAYITAVLENRRTGKAKPGAKYQRGAKVEVDRNSEEGRQRYASR